MGKLTLSVDERIVSRAKKYAKQRGLSISRMVETYLETVAGPAPAAKGDTPVLRALRGSLKHADLDERRRYLAAKHR